MSPQYNPNQGGARFDNRSGTGNKMNRVFKTEKGTELPILSLRGRDYLEVKYRLVWFREEHHDWSIETEIVNLTDTSAFVRAAIRDDQGRVIATSHKFENKQGFPDFIEKAETGAIGRALALIGYGTQFCADELDEGERIVDSPVDARPSASSAASTHSSSQASTLVEQAAEEEVPDETLEESMDEDKMSPGDYRIGFGRKYRGKRLSEISRSEIEGYVAWLESDAAKKGMPLSDEAQSLKAAVTRYVRESPRH